MVDFIVTLFWEAEALIKYRVRCDQNPASQDVPIQLTIWIILQFSKGLSFKIIFFYFCANLRNTTIFKIVSVELISPLISLNAFTLGLTFPLAAGSAYEYRPWRKGGRQITYTMFKRCHGDAGRAKWREKWVLWLGGHRVSVITCVPQAGHLCQKQTHHSNSLLLIWIPLALWSAHGKAGSMPTSENVGSVVVDQALNQITK